MLYADGHVEFQQTVFCGAQGDNIYTARATGPSSSPAVAPNVAASTSRVAAPFDALDTVMLPFVPK